ncbi:hypothetical protein GCM10009126_29010 [Rhodanobacter caeni]|uniref:Uncharacterized protein n=1 Tax=Rhodanobacter caeni TaxID=657654 RepID=A0ABN0UU72_9GAMM
MGGLVDRVVMAVAEGEPGSGKPAGPITDEVDDGGEFGGHDACQLQEDRKVYGRGKSLGETGRWNRHSTPEFGKILHNIPPAHFKVVTRAGPT